MDLRQKTLPFTFEGRSYRLKCNMNVLADVQEASGGKISASLSGKAGLKNCLMYLAAMMTDYADEQGWTDADGMPLVFSWRALGRVLRPENVPQAEILSLVLDALTPPKSGGVGENTAQPEPTPGN